ncbi:MAG: hypothetical protein VX152_12025 [Pseudomonadota bacterium]|nr:hypothetical protein [Pseudomonadota bacterium]
MPLQQGRRLGQMATWPRARARGRSAQGRLFLDDGVSGGGDVAALCSRVRGGRAALDAELRGLGYATVGGAPRPPT